MPATTYLAHQLLNCTLREIAFVPPGGVWLALHTANPTNAGNVGEVSTAAWPAYARQPMSQGGANSDAFSPPANKAIVNALSILFPAHDGVSPITITHWTLWNAQVGGNPLFYGTLVDPISGNPSSRTLQPTDETIVYDEQLRVEVI